MITNNSTIDLAMALSPQSKHSLQCSCAPKYKPLILTADVDSQLIVDLLSLTSNDRNRF